MNNFSSFIKALSEVARKSQVRNKNREYVLVPLISSLIKQGVTESSADLNTILGSLGLPTLSESQIDRVSRDMNKVFERCLRVSNDSQKKVADFLDRLDRACSTNI